MDIREIQETPIWGLYEKGRNYHRRVGIYTDTDRNYRMYNGNQWEGAKLGDVEPVQKNFIKPIVKYKISVIHDNLYAINYASQNYESREFHKEAERYCEILNGYAAKVWERDKMDFKGRRVLDVNFKYGKDYYLGDIVTMINKYGITKDVRVLSVIESMDDTGAKVIPHFNI